MSFETDMDNWQIRFDEKIWNQLHGNRLLKLKLCEAAKKIGEYTKRERRRIYFNNRGNCNSSAIPTQILEMGLRKLNEHIALAYSIYSEVWNLQGNEKSPAFVTTVYSAGIRPLIAAGRMSIVGRAKKLARSTGDHSQLFRMRMESFERDVERLDQDWRDRLEIETLEIQAKSRRKPQLPQKASIVPADEPRRSVVFIYLASPKITQREICRLLDSQKKIPIPSSWKVSERTWSAALDHPQLKGRVKKYLSTQKKRSRQGSPVT